ncbi:DUF3575 domain-containing protein [Pseudoflavitalea sp. G-6-1-2]|uniref:DUF3575 domain-containing protein n=1 Tax=Pseudoflavitalea sp. G-6-1-2 TaxID=2728841 RepID=UPI00146F0D9E|nr:DUF3575 domain-containing protein [Pseudoflavitalea sp. G-6-1-2]NML22806.1 DUF3575 domain-containing protein [Pseudoflavitalea sp. G-6-1-2]
MDRLKFCALLLLVFIATDAFSQRILHRRDRPFRSISAKPIINDYKYVISIAPMAALDIVDFPSLRISGEAKIYKNISLSAEYGYMPLWNDRNNDNMKGFLVKPAIKYYLNKEEKTGGKYIALEYMYKEKKYDEADSLPLSDDKRYRRNYRMSRYVNCINIKYGELVEIAPDSRWTMEWYAGVGVRFIEASNNLEDWETHYIKEDRTNKPRHPNVYEGRNKVFSNALFNVTLGIKIGFRIQ